MGTRMPIAMEMMKKHGEDMNYTMTPDGKSGFMPALAKQFTRSIFFDIQTAHEILAAQLDARRPPGPAMAKIPYPCTWMEWHDKVTNRYVAAALTEFDPEIHLGGETRAEEQTFALFFTMKPDTDRLFIHPIQSTLIMDSSTYEVERFDVRLLDSDDIFDTNEDRITPYYMSTVTTALGLLNCRNIATDASGLVKFARSGFEKRRNLPAKSIRYSTIVLPGGGTVSDGKGGHRATAIHRVRGHFKTFTADKPMLGKHVGTYWWGWQVRGNAEKGVVISDYKLSPHA